MEGYNMYACTKRGKVVSVMLCYVTLAFVSAPSKFLFQVTVDQTLRDFHNVSKRQGKTNESGWVV